MLDSCTLLRWPFIHRQSVRPSLILYICQSRQQQPCHVSQTIYLQTGCRWFVSYRWRAHQGYLMSSLWCHLGHQNIFRSCLKYNLVQTTRTQTPSWVLMWSKSFYKSWRTDCICVCIIFTERFCLCVQTVCVSWDYTFVLLYVHNVDIGIFYLHVSS